MLNAINANPLAAVNIDPIWVNNTGVSSAASAIPNNTPKVPTTFSLATKPVNVETADCQFPNPSGANIGAITFPMLEHLPFVMSS